MKWPAAQREEGGDWRENPLNASIKLLGVCQLARTTLSRGPVEMRIYYKLIKLSLLLSPLPPPFFFDSISLDREPFI